MLQTVSPPPLHLRQYKEKEPPRFPKTVPLFFHLLFNISILAHSICHLLMLYKLRLTGFAPLLPYASKKSGLAASSA